MTSQVPIYFRLSQRKEDFSPVFLIINILGNNLPDEVKVSKMMLKDFIQGRLLYVKPPPNAPADLWTSNKVEDLEHQIEIGQKEEEKQIKQN